MNPLRMIVVTLLVFSLPACTAKDDRELNELRREVATLRSSLSDSELLVEQLRVVASSRTDRFKRMSYACARLVNQYVEDYEGLWWAARGVVNGERSIGGLADFMMGQGMSEAWGGDYFLRLDRAGCGMKVEHPMKTTDVVTPIAKAWRDGVEPPEF